MNPAISQTVSKWVKEETRQRTLALKVIRQNDPWRDVPEEEVEDSKEFIRCYLLRDFELVLQIPTQSRDDDFWFSSYKEFMESAFNTHDFQKDRKPFDKYGYKVRKTLEQVKDLATLHSCISQHEGRNNVCKRYKSIVENEFRMPILDLVERLNRVTDREKRSEMIHKIVEFNKRIHQSKAIWEQYSPPDG